MASIFSLFRHTIRRHYIKRDENWKKHDDSNTYPSERPQVSRPKKNFWAESALQDVRFAIRGFFRSPLVSLVVVTTFAIGIGASTAIFSVVYAIALRPLSYPDADRLIRIYEANPKNSQLRAGVSVGAFRDWRDRVMSVESLALYTKVARRFLAGPDQVPVSTMRVSPQFFEVLRVRPLLGDGFRSEKDYGAEPTNDAILSYSTWQRFFGGRRDIIGARIEFAGVRDTDSFRVVGVMPQKFVFEESVDVWFPSIVRLPINPGVRNWRFERVLGRLRKGKTLGEARAEFESVAAHLAREFPASNEGWTITLESLHDSIVGNFNRGIWLLLTALMVVLIVTCLNVGGLLVTRNNDRRREIALRVTLGAGLPHLVSLRLIEASLLIGIGLLFGLLFAWAGVAALKAVAPATIPRLDAIALDLPVLTMATLAVVITVILLILIPLWRIQRRDFVAGIHTTFGVGGVQSTGKARVSLTVAQCAGATVLVTLALMLTRSFVELKSIDLGWESSHVLSMSVSPPMPRQLQYPWYRYVEWSDRLIRRLEGTTGIESAAITTQVPFSSDLYWSVLALGRRENRTASPRWPTVEHIVTDDYFQLMNVRLTSGRTFEQRDRFSESQLTSPNRVDQGVIIVTEAVARAIWPNRPAIGEALWLPSGDNCTWRQVIGVVEDVKFHKADEVPTFHVFIPWTQRAVGRPRLLVKTSTTNITGASIRDMVRTVEAGTQIDQVEWLDDLVSGATAQQRFTSQLFSTFATLALILAAAGIYATISYVVGVRTREIGVCLALGASRSRIMGDVFSHVVVQVTAGTSIGLALTLILARIFRSVFFGVEPLDVGSYIAGVSVLMLTAFLATLGPARKASLLDPSAALRAE